MSTALIEAAGLAESPLDAAAQFHGRIVPLARDALAAGDVVVAFDPADHTHAGWRLAAVQELAREAAPRRVNAVVGGAGSSRDQVIAFLGRAPGVTGQILTVDGNPPQSA